MKIIGISRFKENLKNYIEEVVSTHTPLKVAQHSSEDDFVVISAGDWERERETLYVLQNSSLMKQIAKSMSTHVQREGYHPTEEELDDIS